MTGTVTVFLTTTNSIYILILCLVGFTAPFWHVFYGIRTTEGIFGYSYMSSFLNAIGSKLFMLCFSLLLLIASKKIQDPKFIKIFKRVAFMGLFVSSYFIIFIFIPKKTLKIAFGINDFHPVFYYLSMVFLSLMSTNIFILFQKAMTRTEDLLKKKIKYLFDILYSLDPFIKKSKKEAFAIKRIEVTDYIILGKDE